MTLEEIINKKCQKITNDINNLVADADQKIKTASERAKTAEDMLARIKAATAEEIKKAYNMGFQLGRRTIISDSDNTGGTQKAKEENFKLVLEN